MEHNPTAVLVILIVVLLVGISIPILMYSFQFEANERAVWFTRDGVPHCPYCFRIVNQHTGYCERCQKTFRWRDQAVECLDCDGAKYCQTCHGSGIVYHRGEYIDCPECGATGECPECYPNPYALLQPQKKFVSRKDICYDLEGYVVHGGSSIKHPDMRK